MSGKDPIFQSFKIARSGISAFNEIASFTGHIISGLGAIFAVAGTASSVKGSVGLIDVTDTPLALRIVLLLFIAGAMGWSFGALVSWLTSDQSETRKLLSAVIAMASAGLLVFSADWLSVARKNAALPELQLFTAVGMGVALWVATYQFRIHAEGIGRGVLQSRATNILIFSVVCVFLLLVTMVGS